MYKEKLSYHCQALKNHCHYPLVPAGEVSSFFSRGNSCLILERELVAVTIEKRFGSAIAMNSKAKIYKVPQF